VFGWLCLYGVMCLCAAQNMWALVDSGAEPGPRAFHSAVVYELNSRPFMLIFGGTDGSSISKNDLWRYDFQINDWALIGPGNGILPASRVAHQALVNLVNGLPYMWVFGGQGAEGELNDVWIFDPSQQLWSQIDDSSQEVEPRAYFCATTVSATSNMIYGGYSSTATSPKYSSMLLGDMWLHSLLLANDHPIARMFMVIH